MIVVTYDVGNYRRLLGKIVKDNSIVIEIGPHTGKSTLNYLSKAKHVIVVDKAQQSRKKFKKLLQEYQNLSFVHGDVRSFSTIKKVLKITRQCDVFAVDMGGGRFPDTVFKVWATWSGIFKPEHSVIRSRGLAEFIKRAKVRDKDLPKKFRDDGWLSTFGRGTPYKLRKQLDEFKYWIDINKSLE